MCKSLHFYCRLKYFFLQLKNANKLFNYKSLICMNFGMAVITITYSLYEYYIANIFISTLWKIMKIPKWWKLITSKLQVFFYFHQSSIATFIHSKQLNRRISKRSHIDIHWPHTRTHTTHATAENIIPRHSITLKNQRTTSAHIYIPALRPYTFLPRFRASHRELMQIARRITRRFRVYIMPPPPT